MKSSIYISPEQIEIIGYIGKGRGIVVKEVLSRELPEGVIINGKITDAGQLLEVIRYLRAHKPEFFISPTLIVDGSSIVSKRIAVPKLSKKQYQRLIHDDFADTADNIDELVCGYQEVDSLDSSQTAILACATAKENVESYVSVFKEAGVRIKAIRVGVQSVINYVASRADFHKKCVVINIVDGVTMLSMIFDNGTNVFVSRTRLYTEDYEEFVQRLQENLSGLVQFNRSQKFGDIACSYYLGLSNEDVALLNEINPHSDVRIEKLNLAGSINSNIELSNKTHLSVLGAMLPDSSIDFINSIKQLEKLKKRERPKRYWIPVIIGTVVLLAIPSAYLFYASSQIYKEIAEINDYMQNPDIVAKSEAIDKIIAETAHITDIATQRELNNKADNRLPDITNQVLDLITTTLTEKTTVTTLAFDEKTGIIRVSAYSATERDSAAYVEEIKKSKLIDSVSYKGYNHGNEGQFIFSIDVKLSVEEENQ